MSERVVVTGGAGFIGSHVAERYLADGYEVTILDNLSTGRRENIPAGAKLVCADIGSPEARELLADGGVSILNHHAAQLDVRVSVSDPELDARTNLLGLLNLLEGGRVGGLRRVVFASSGGVVYGESPKLPHLESAPKAPVSPYGVSKLASEYYLSVYARLYGIGVVSLRYANIYGPRQDPHGEAGVVAIFGQCLKRGHGVTVYGDGEQTRDYVFVEDVARANLAATRCTVPPIEGVDGNAYNIGTGMQTTVNVLIETMFQATGTRVPVSYAPERPGELRCSAISPERAGRDWSWRPEVGLAEGLRRTCQWIAGVNG